MFAALEIAKYFLTLQDEESGDLISNLKLQKLLYYAQGYHLAMHNEPIFSEAILAWEHGPVVPEVYYAYRACGSDAIPVPEDFDLAQIPCDKQQFLNEVYRVIGQFSAWKLRNMTHDEPPWRDAPRNGVIEHESMRQFFGTLVEV